MEQWGLFEEVYTSLKIIYSLNQFPQHLFTTNSQWKHMSSTFQCRCSISAGFRWLSPSQLCWAPHCWRNLCSCIRMGYESSTRWNGKWYNGFDGWWRIHALKWIFITYHDMKTDTNSSGFERQRKVDQLSEIQTQHKMFLFSIPQTQLVSLIGHVNHQLAMPPWYPILSNRYLRLHQTHLNLKTQGFLEENFTFMEKSKLGTILCLS